MEAAFAERFPLWLAFCHNDLQYGNMLLFPGSSGGGSSDGGGAGSAAAPATPAAAGAAAERAGAQQGQQAGDGPVIRLIDYEYSTPNDVAYDIANHW